MRRLYLTHCLARFATMLLAFRGELVWSRARCPASVSINIFLALVIFASDSTWYRMTATTLLFGKAPNRFLRTIGRNFKKSSARVVRARLATTIEGCGGVVGHSILI